MNEDIFAGQWKQMRGELKMWWGRLADDDLDRIAGDKDQLIGLVQEKYGYNHEHAEQDLERRFKELGEKSREVVASVTAKTQELGMITAIKANEAATVVGEKIGSLTHVTGDNVPHDGPVASAATAVVGWLESASLYLHGMKLTKWQKRSLLTPKADRVRDQNENILFGKMLTL
jgi:uncharacterized protein YjbJ (UPF0337 family)